MPDRHRLAAARRLIPPETRDREAAARRVLSGDHATGVRPDLMWAVIDDARPDSPVREACLMILGPGRTAIAFLSGPEDPRQRANPRPDDTRDRAACLKAAVADMASLMPDRVRVVQALPHPGDRWAVEAYAEGGFRRIGELSYLRASLRPTPSDRTPADLPEHVEIRPIHDLTPGSDERDALERAMDRSYIDTLDCPALCGIRTTPDILDSHLAVGRWSPDTWSLVFAHGEPEGCCLLSHVPEQRTHELVYLGLGPNLRGQGLSRRILGHGLASLDTTNAPAVICAVDTENTPAVRLYRSMGFNPVARREAFVSTLPQTPVDTPSDA